MKAVAYSIKPFEKEFLAKANQKKHDITLISNALSLETAIYAIGKEAVIVFTNDDVSEKVIQILAGFGIKYIATRSGSTDHIDKAAIAKYGIKLANVPCYPLVNHIGALTSPVFFTIEELQLIADQTIRNLDLWQLGKCTGKACCCTGKSLYKPK
jgi:lactate dehydrogenase-like 2-hydroxyacid dehydrogenase